MTSFASALRRVFTLKVEDLTEHKVINASGHIIEEHKITFNFSSSFTLLFFSAETDYSDGLSVW